MNVYTTDKIRNVVILGHGGAGKTSLVEAMAFLSGITSRMGNVADGNTVSDFDKEEQNRKFSISTSVVPVVRKDVKINVLDAPGYFDFVGEVEEAVSLKGFLLKNHRTNEVAVFAEKPESGAGEADAIETVIRPLRVLPSCTLLEVELITGKTHQIRAHLAHLGFLKLRDLSHSLVDRCDDEIL